jgi:hypothetical protein
MVEERNGLGTICSVDGRKGPTSYLVRDLGRAGTPTLVPTQREMLRRIRIYVHPSTLRIAFIGSEFIVFDAAEGPCYPQAPGYSVLNGDCNEMYSPTDNFEHTGAGTGCWSAPRPWIPHDVGNPKAPPWTTYPNSH